MSKNTHSIVNFLLRPNGLVSCATHNSHSDDVTRFILNKKEQKTNRSIIELKKMNDVDTSKILIFFDSEDFQHTHSSLTFKETMHHPINPQGIWLYNYFSWMHLVNFLIKDLII